MCQGLCWVFYTYHDVHSMFPTTLWRRWFHNPHCAERKLRVKEAKLILPSHVARELRLVSGKAGITCAWSPRLGSQIHFSNIYYSWLLRLRSKLQWWGWEIQPTLAEAEPLRLMELMCLRYRGYVQSGDITQPPFQAVSIILFWIKTSIEKKM